MPSGLVITRLPVPVLATATNMPRADAQQTLSQLLSAADARAVQLMPSGLVITRLPVPVLATATNSDLSGDQLIARQSLSAALVRIVQLMPSGLVITRLPVPVLATAANRPRDGAQATDVHWLSVALVRIVQLMPIFGSSPPPPAALRCAKIPGIIMLPPIGRSGSKCWMRAKALLLLRQIHRARSCHWRAASR